MNRKKLHIFLVFFTDLFWRVGKLLTIFFVLIKKTEEDMRCWKKCPHFLCTSLADLAIFDLIKFPSEHGFYRTVCQPWQRILFLRGSFCIAEKKKKNSINFRFKNHIKQCDLLKNAYLWGLGTSSALKNSWLHQKPQ